MPRRAGSGARRTIARAAATASELAPRFGHDLADHPPVVMAQLRVMTAYDATPHLTALAALPTLVVTAEEDRIAPPTLGRALSDGIPGAVYHERAGAEHGIPIHRAAEVNALLREHIQRVEARIHARVAADGGFEVRFAYDGYLGKLCTG